MQGGFQIAWKIEGTKELSRVLVGMQNDLRDYRKPFTQSADMLTALFSGQVFESQGAVIGEKWKRLSPRTVARKAKLGYPATPLVATGSMQRDFASVVKTNEAVISNGADYFKYHQSNKPRHVLPRRVMMKLNEDSKQRIVKFFQVYIREAMRGRAT